MTSYRKRLIKSDKKMIFGVCGGVAEFFNLDSTILRIIVLLIFIFTGFFPIGIIYLGLALIMPTADGSRSDRSYGDRGRNTSSSPEEEREREWERQFRR